MNYLEYKWKFNHILCNRFSLSPRDMTSFVGLKTMIGEMAGDSHVDAFCNAVDELREIDDIEFTSQYRSLKAAYSLCEISVDRKLNRYSVMFDDIERMLTSDTEKTFVSVCPCGLGLERGLETAGYRALAVVDKSDYVLETVRNNWSKKTKKLCGDTHYMRDDYIRKMTKTFPGDIDVLVGSPPYQHHSPCGKKLHHGHPRASPTHDFIRFIRDLSPRYFVLTYPVSILTASIEEVTGFETFDIMGGSDNSNSLGSVMSAVLKMLQETGYELSCSCDDSIWDDKLVNYADYGVAYIQPRVVIIGSRDGPVSLPTPTHCELSTDETKGRLPWETLWDSIWYIRSIGEYGQFSNSTEKYLSSIPPGNNWRSLNKIKRMHAMRANVLFPNSKNEGFYRRLMWDRPCPGISLNPAFCSITMCHPETLRPLSINECIHLQGFDESWRVNNYGKENITQQYYSIMGSIPQHMGYVIGKHLNKAL